MNARIHACVTGVLLWGTSAVFAQSPIVASDVLRLKTISDVDVAPDGSYAVYVVREIVEDDDGYAYRNQIWRAELDGEPRARAITGSDRGSASPAISPDGSRLAFVRASGDGPAQVWVMPMNEAGEARQLTSLEHGASQPVWRPDGGALLVSSSIPFGEIEGSPPWDDERQRRTWRDADVEEGDEPSPDGDLAEVRRWLHANAEAADPSVISRLNFQAEQGLRGEMTAAHLFSIDIDDGEASQLTSGFKSHGEAVWSPDGASIVFSTRESTIHPDRVLDSIIMTMKADGAGLDYVGVTGLSARAPSFGEDGVLRALCRDSDDPLFGQWDVCEIGDRLPRNVTEAWDSGVGSYWGMGDGSVILTSNWQGTRPIVVVGAGGDTAAMPLDGDAGVQSMDVGGGRIAAAVTTPTHPMRLIMVDRDGRERVVHDPNEWIAERTLATPTEHWIERDGLRIQYWVMAPTTDGAGPHKTALEIHGGPAAMWGPGELSMWHEFQLLCAWGYGVVYSNPRGSSGYGYDFRRANEQDWGVGPSGDVLACLDDAMQRYDWIDEDRLVVTGGSYAGYLTAWIVAHDHRFKAALAQRGVYDLTTFFGEGNAWRLVPWAMGGYPWEPAREVLERESPFTWVEQIRTPLLIMHASQDLRTGVSQSEMLYKALKVLGRPTEYVRYPNAGHDLSRTGDPKQRMDRLLRIVEWFERYVADDASGGG